MALPLFIFFLQTIFLLPIPEADRIEAKADLRLLSASEQIDLVYVGGRFSHIEYTTASPSRTFTPPFPVYSFTPQMTRFGSCSQKGNVLTRRKGDRHCGYIIPLDSAGRAVNLLSYDEVILQGKFSGDWELAFADTVHSLNEENVPLASKPSSEGWRFDFGSARSHVDAANGRHLVLLLRSSSGSAALQEVAFRHTPRSSSHAGNGIWIWRHDRVIGHEAEVLDRLRARAVKRVYLQIGDDPAIFHDFLAAAARQGVSVFALDGDPGYIFSPAPLLARIRAVESYNRSNPDAPYAGFQTDIEPYLNSDFNLRKSEYAAAYVDLLRQIKATSRLPLSVVAPFWFDGLTTDGRSLAQRFVEEADEVVLMSYRTDPAAVLEISRNTLALGERFNKPVRLGIELGSIPDEHHIELKKTDRTQPDTLRLGGFLWKKQSEYDINGARISHKSSMPSLPAFMATPFPFSSFGGWVLHSYEELN